MSEPLTFGSVCSGAAGLDGGLEDAGFTPAWLCENDPKCQSVLRHHFPGLTIHDNLEGLADRDLRPVRLLAGGTPCQDLSVAGQRKGLGGERSGLFFEFIRLADRLAPDGILWENVDGALSSNHGEDFAVCLEGFTGWRPSPPPRAGGRRASASAHCAGQSGACLTLNISEWPSDAVVCSLWQVLEESPAPKYYLSPKACQGILRRAEKRGKTLPDRLAAALRAGATAPPISTTPPTS